MSIPKEAVRARRQRRFTANGGVPRYLAFHEAGHAVARLALDRVAPCPGPYIRRVMVRPADAWGTPFVEADGYAQDTQGVVDTQTRVSSWSPWLDKTAENVGVTEERHAESVARERAGVWLDILEALAGPVAETRCRRDTSLRGVCRFIGIPVAPAAGRPEGSDVRWALHRLGILGRPQEEIYTAWEEAWTLMRENWAAVAALAEALLAKHEIDGEEVGEIVPAALPDVRRRDQPAEASAS